MSDENNESFEALKALAENPPPIGEIVQGFSHRDMAEAMERDKQRQKNEAEQRERDRFKAAIAAYDHFGWIAGAKRTAAYSCPMCSAVVRDREQHQRWHDALAVTARHAANAHFYTTPIG